MPTDQKKPLTVGKYELVHKVAEGGMGAVFRARHQASGDIVAIKIVPPNLASNQVLLRRFEQEFKAARLLNHPNVVRAIEFGFEDKTPYLVMEFVEGETLGQRIDRVGKVPEADAVDVIVQIAEGLFQAHSQGLVHRDVKPDNILIQPDGVAKLTDMGLVKEVEADLNLTRTGRGLGTPHFMSPEQFRNAKNANARCDVYSLAATLYMAVTGELPFKSCTPLDAWMKKVQNDFPSAKQLNPAVSDHLDQVIRRAMSADPQQRPADCREFIAELKGRITVRAAAPAREKNGVASDQWYLRHKDEAGATHTVKGSLAAIRRCLREGYLGNAENVFVSRAKAGPFEPLLAQSEFRDLQSLLPGPGDILPPPADGGGASRPPAIRKSVPSAGAFKSSPPPSAFKSTPAPSSFKSATGPSGISLSKPGSSARKRIPTNMPSKSMPPPAPPPAQPPDTPVGMFRTPQIDILPNTAPELPVQGPSGFVSAVTWLIFLVTVVAAMLAGLWLFAPGLFSKWLGK